jgi:hypothetical protein
MARSLWPGISRYRQKCRRSLWPRQTLSRRNSRSISTSVTGIKNMEAQTLNGTSVQKIYFQPDVNLDLAIAQMVSATNAIRDLMPAGIQAPIVEAPRSPNRHCWPDIRLGVMWSRKQRGSDRAKNARDAVWRRRSLDLARGNLALYRRPRSRWALPQALFLEGRGDLCGRTFI